jgi:hypothetical protein
MRITRELLHKFAQQTVKARLRSEPDIHAAYMMGSLIKENPLLGGITDIDLVLVHKYQAPAKRECLPLTPDVSLDIYHKIREDYADHRSFRQDPWMGYPLTHYNIILYDSEHWLEFIQSSVNAEFHRPDNVLKRVRKFSNAARENWFSMFQQPPQSHNAWLDRYLEILSLAANSISGLIGPPLTRRRFLMSFQERVETLGVVKVLAGFYGLLGLSEEQHEHLEVWADAFKQDLAFLSESTTPPVHLHPCRHKYYLNGIEALINGESPSHAIWPLLKTWLDVQMASKQTTPHVETWKDCLSSLGLTEERTADKIDALDAYLDSIEIVIESWEDAYGI